AHVDHGWREESGDEAAYLTQFCEKAGVKLHQKKLNPPQHNHNLEDEGRKARLAFFKDVIQKGNFKGIALAHHADDQAETVLKRVFEGANLPKLRGLTPSAHVNGILILRPLLHVSKKQIVEWLHSKQIPFFHDTSNQDPRFLRSRLREEIIP